MLRRYQAALALLPRVSFRPATALRASLAEGYSKRKFVRDATAGVVVGIVALPLAMALAINSGVAPQHGIYTAIVAGLVVALLGGSRTNVTGPTAAFIVILAPISSQYGVGGLMVATVMAGVILVLMGFARLGRLIEFIPHPVTTGFTAGIAVVIATTQIDKIFGLEGKFRDHWLDRVADLILAAPTAKWQDFIVGAVTLALLIAWPRYNKKVPPAVVALTAATVVGVLLSLFGAQVTTLATKFSWSIGGHGGHGIPPYPPLPVLPWHQAGPGGKPLELSFEMLSALAPKAIAIAMLGAIESLLCAVVGDGMAGMKHDPDSELMAQGVGNIVAPFFGGIAATGALARTATNIRSGGKTPIAAATHALFVLLAVVVLAPGLGFLPMAAMAALLLVVAWNMSEIRHFRHILQVAPRSDVLVLLTCFSLTVLFDMVLSVSVGVMLAALLFMRRMAELSGARLVGDLHRHKHGPLPRDVLFYEIDGPLFFGAAQKAIDALAEVNATVRVVVLDLEGVPVMDVSGLVAFESAVERLQKLGAFVILAGVQAQPRGVLHKGGLVDQPGKLMLCESVDRALELARERSMETVPPPDPSTPPPPPLPAVVTPPPPIASR